jgi:hypothetical protein
MPSYLPILQNFGGVIGVNTSGLVNDVPGDAGWKHLLVGTSIFQTEAYPSAHYTAAAGC